MSHSFRNPLNHLRASVSETLYPSSVRENEIGKILLSLKNTAADDINSMSPKSYS